MNDDPTIHDTDDELVSAYLDGEATPDEAARVEADPVLLARLEVLRGVAGAVAAPVPPPAAAIRDASIAAAVAAADQGVVTDLAAARGRRRLRVVSIAAAVLAVLAIGAGVLSQSGGNDTKSATVAARADQASSAPESGGAATGAAPGPPGPLAATVAGGGDLGDFTDSAALVDILRSRFATRTADQSANNRPDTTPGPADGVRASSPCPTPADLVFEATARLAGEPVTVLVVGPPDQQLVEVRDAACTIVFSQPL